LSGTLRFVRGEGRPGQIWDLEGEIFDPDGSTFSEIAQAELTSKSDYPVIQVDLVQTNGVVTRTYLLTLEAEPFAGLWFSTAHGFTPDSGGGYVTGGNLLSHTGEIVRTNQSLLAPFEPVGALDPDPGLDAVDVLPGGIAVFSTNADFTSDTLGQIGHGDVLLDDGRILHRNAELLAAFILQPSATDYGLDALHVLPGGDMLFSLTEDAFSEGLGRALRHGDLLSSAGQVIRTNAELLERFHLPAEDQDFGLDAVYQLPSGEIWFSLTAGFQDGQLGAIWPGDVLSDQGYVVYHSLDLMLPFRPLEDLSDFQTDAFLLYGIEQPPEPPRFLTVQANPADDTLFLEWTGGGRVFQLFRADSLEGPFETLTQPGPTRSFLDSEALSSLPAAFYRVEQW
jgi:hypothetical protein